ncbi:hypothetical protein CKO25_09360 [Thiocapsa imhoffii]|uniref:TonB-dependent receptor n=2 Tax=Thiocapsa imhoffii TaxID=382777 RepID=A0A9X1B8K2_9GAMM|nr:hypothetical protein [Thiocapsa imhoffii]
MQGNLNAEYDLTERLTLLLGLLYTNFDSQQDPDQSDGYGGDFGVRYQWSERTTFRALVGARKVDSRTVIDGIGINNNSTGPIFQVAFDRELGPGLASVSLERSLLPSGRGTLLDTTQAIVALSYPVSERATARIRAMGVRNRNPDDGFVNFNDRDFLMLNPGLRWRVAENTWLDLSYRYRYQDREVVEGSADSNAFFIGFGHDWLSR